MAQRKNHLREMQVKAAMKHKVQEYEKLVDRKGQEVEMVEMSGPP